MTERAKRLYIDMNMWRHRVPNAKESRLWSYTYLSNHAETEQDESVYGIAQGDIIELLTEDYTTFLAVVVKRDGDRIEYEIDPKSFREPEWQGNLGVYSSTENPITGNVWHRKTA